MLCFINGKEVIIMRVVGFRKGGKGREENDVILF